MIYIVISFNDGVQGSFRSYESAKAFVKRVMEAWFEDEDDWDLYFEIVESSLND